MATSICPLCQTSKENVILFLLNCVVSVDINLSFGRFMSTGNNLFIFVGENNQPWCLPGA